MHLAATNLALWVRLIVWESGNEWTYFVYLSQSSGVRGGVSNNIPTPLQLRGFPRSVVTRHQRDLTFSKHSLSSFKPQEQQIWQYNDNQSIFIESILLFHKLRYTDNFSQHNDNCLYKLLHVLTLKDHH